MDTQSIMMRNYIVLAEDYATAGVIPIIPEPPVVPLEEVDMALLRELSETVERLRAHMEPADSDPEVALGVEMGMQRAADLIESLVRRFKEPD